MELPVFLPLTPTKTPLTPVLYIKISETSKYLRKPEV